MIIFRVVRLEIHLAGKARQLELERKGHSVRAKVDGRPVEANALLVAPGVYSILLEGRSFEVRVTPKHDGLHIHSDGVDYVVQVADPRSWRGRQGSAASTEGRQQIVAPMPGKVIRILVQAGDAVEAGRGVLVVEAMKMQNEIRSPKSGTVEKLLVKEGQPVNAGEVLAVIA